jgi:prophage regulatory protein
MSINKLIELIRRAEVLQLTQRSKSSLYLDEQNGIFCPPVSIGCRAKAYLKHEVETVIQARIEGQTLEQLKALVKNLIANRTANKGGIKL